MRLRKYLLSKFVWYAGAFIAALILNFLLPRLVPGNPVDAIVANLAKGGGAQGEQVRNIQTHYVHEFGLDKSMLSQFFTYLGNLAHGDFGTSFAQYPAKVRGLIGQALPWSIALQLP